MNKANKIQRSCFIKSCGDRSTIGSTATSPYQLKPDAGNHSRRSVPALPPLPKTTNYDFLFFEHRSHGMGAARTQHLL